MRGAIVDETQPCSLQTTVDGVYSRRMSVPRCQSTWVFHDQQADGDPSACSPSALTPRAVPSSGNRSAVQRKPWRGHALPVKQTRERRELMPGRRAVVRGAIVAALCLGLTALQACGGDDSADETSGANAANAPSLGLIKPGTLIVAQDNDIPWTQLKGGSLTGIDGEVMTEVAKRLDLKLDVRTMQFPAEIPSAQQGRVDVAIGGIVDNPDRRKIVALSNVFPYTYFLEYSQIGECKYTTLTDFRTKTLGTITGFALAEQYKELLPDVKIKFYPAADAALQDLVRGRVDALSLGSGPASHAAKQHPEWNLQVCPHDPSDIVPTSISNRNVVYAFNKDDTALRDSVDKIVTELRSDGTMERILSSYVPADQVDTYLNPK